MKTENKKLDVIDQYYPDKPEWFKEMIRRHSHVDLHRDTPDLIVYTETDLLEIVNIAQNETKKEIENKVKFLKYSIIFFVLVFLFFTGFIVALGLY